MNIEQVIEQVLDLVEDVPFANSDTQNRVVIVDKEQTPCRALRHSALRIMNRLSALREYQYTKRRREIEIKILQRDMEKEPDELKRELITLDIEHRRGDEAYERKLVKDAIREVASLWPVLQGMGKVTRDEFEAEEIAHYAEKHQQALDLSRDLFARVSKGGALPSFGELIALTSGAADD